MLVSKFACILVLAPQSLSAGSNYSFPDGCDSAYAPITSCPAGSSQGSPQTDWNVVATRTCPGPCDGYSTLQWTAKQGVANNAIKSRNGGSLISPKHQIPSSIDELRCWFLPEFSWGYQNPGPAPPWNPQPEVAYIDDAGNGLCGGLPGPDTTVATCCQEETTCEMMELRHWIFSPPGCSTVDTNYNTDGNAGRVILSKTSDRGGKLPSSKHEACMCGDRTSQNQLPFYYYVVKGPEKDNSQTQLQSWLDALRTAYNHLFDIWSQRPPCSGECVIMGGASDAWESYAHSTSRSVYFQLRAFASFDPHALPNACGVNGVMLRFGGMTLDDDSAVTCQGKDNWGQTGASCPTIAKIASNFKDIVTVADDSSFFAQAGSPGNIMLETDRAVVTISLDSGVEVKQKRTSCPKPTLDIPWRCNGRGGISDKAGCASTPNPGPSPTPPSPQPAPSPHHWVPCSRGQCCNPHSAVPQYCPGGILCHECGGGNACQCPNSILV